MDVHCSTCGEPWDTEYLRHEAVFDTELNVEEAQAWRSLPSTEKLTDRYRKVFRTAGWIFGQTVINISHCPCCPRNTPPDVELVRTKAALEELLGGDEDGLAATFEDYHL